MKKLTARTTSAVGAIAVSMAIFGTGVANADSYAGQTYADASSALSKAGLKGVIAGRVGGILPDYQCVVTHSQKAPWIKGDHFAAVSDTVLLFLNCNATVASATAPGNSPASPEGRAAVAKQVQDKVDYFNAHPEFCAQYVDYCKQWCDAHAGACKS